MENGGRNSTGTAQRGNDWLNAQSQASDLDWKVMVRSVLEDIAFVFFLASQTETPWRLQEHPNYQRILCSHAQTYFKVTSNIFSNRELQFENDFSRCCARLLAWIMLHSSSGSKVGPRNVSSKQRSHVTWAIRSENCIPRGQRRWFFWSRCEIFDRVMCMTVYDMNISIYMKYHILSYSYHIVIYCITYV